MAIKKKNIIDLSDYIRDVRNMYSTDMAQQTFNCFLAGEVGSGKTHMIQTARQPILIHSFDPGGTKHLQPCIEEGWMLVDTRFELDRLDAPKAYKLWEEEFEKMYDSGIFDSLGTFVVDSFTMFVLALKYKIVKDNGRKDGVMTMHDWQVLGNIIIDVIKTINSLGCDVIFTGHLTLEKDEVTGKQKAMLATIPSLQSTLPQLFDEIYVIEATETSKGIDRSVVTANTGKYQCRTRIGSGKFDTREEADFGHLLKKAGKDFSYKPTFEESIAEEADNND